MAAFGLAASLLGCETYSCEATDKPGSTGLECSSKDGDTSEDVGAACEVSKDNALPGEIPYCVDERVWSGNDEYCFYVTNPACQADPVDEAAGGEFLVGEFRFA